MQYGGRRHQPCTRRKASNEVEQIRTPLATALRSGNPAHRFSLSPMPDKCVQNGARSRLQVGNNLWWHPKPNKGSPPLCEPLSGEITRALLPYKSEWRTVAAPTFWGPGRGYSSSGTLPHSPHARLLKQSFRVWTHGPCTSFFLLRGVKLSRFYS